MSTSPRTSQYHKDAVESVVEWLVTDGMSFLQLAHAARLAIVNTYVKSIGGGIDGPTDPEEAAAFRADSEATNKLTMGLLRQPHIGPKSLFECYQTVHFIALVKHYVDETDPSAATYGDEKASMDKAFEQGEELKNYLKSLLP